MTEPGPPCFAIWKFLAPRRVYNCVRRLFLAAVVLLVSCTSVAGPLAADPPATSQATTTDAARGVITVPLTLHVAVEQGDPTSALSSTRTTDELAVIAANMADIWAQADVVFDPINVHQVDMPPAVLQGILLGNTDPFFDQVNATFQVQSSQAINGFYVRSAFGVNGFTPQGSNLYFVVDEPSVHDERVSSHEVGHIFGLHHVPDDPTTLMFSGTNGTTLSELEQTVARYGVQGLFPQGIDP